MYKQHFRRVLCYTRGVYPQVYHSKQNKKGFKFPVILGLQKTTDIGSYMSIESQLPIKKKQTTKKKNKNKNKNKKMNEKPVLFFYLALHL